MLDGLQRDVRWARIQGGEMPARLFYEKLAIRDQAKMYVLFERFAQEGRITNSEHFKKLEGTGLFEFKRFQVRILCCMKGRELVLCHGVIKKQDKHRQADIDKAERICAEDLGSH